ncbi:hypothetical protein R6Q57_024100 [Mikania cordata]
MNLYKLTFISQIISSLSTSLGFDGAINVDITEFQTNLIPSPHVHFMFPSYAPVIINRKKHTIVRHYKRVFEPASMMAKCKPLHGKYIAYCLMYRGNVVPKDVKASVATIKPRVQFVKWKEIKYAKRPLA